MYEQKYFDKAIFGGFMFGFTVGSKIGHSPKKMKSEVRKLALWRMGSDKISGNMDTW